MGCRLKLTNFEELMKTVERIIDRANRNPEWNFNAALALLGSLKVLATCSTYAWVDSRAACFKRCAPLSHVERRLALENRPLPTFRRESDATFRAVRAPLPALELRVLGAAGL